MAAGKSDDGSGKKPQRRVYTTPLPRRITGEKEITGPMKRTILILLLLSATSLAAQQPKTSTTTTSTSTNPPAATATASEEPQESSTSTSSEEVRERLHQKLRRVPSDVPTILALDPSLLSNEKFMADYPELAQYLASHPDVRRNPHYYFGTYRPRDYQPSPSRDIAEMVAVIFGFGLATFVLTWLVRTFVDQTRWSRMSRTQSEVHNKILDRIGSGPEFVEYLKSPPGSKFLESAPIPIHAEKPVANGPVSRIMWSIQLGIVIAAGGLGMLLVSWRLDPDAGRALFTLGAIALSVGLGFVISAAVSVAVSKRLGLWRGPTDDAETMR
jgi:hypothetical protein